MTQIKGNWGYSLKRTPPFGYTRSYGGGQSVSALPLGSDINLLGDNLC